MSTLEVALDTAPLRLSEEDQMMPLSKPTPATSLRNSALIASARAEGLPMIDIAAFLNPDASREARLSTASAIHAACTNYGFFYLTGHGIPEERLDEIVSLARQFFDLDIEEKNKIKRFDAGGPEGGDGARGYQGLGENVTGGLQDMQEAIDFYAEWPKDKCTIREGGASAVTTLQGINLWPERPQSLRETYLRYIEDVKRVGAALVHAMGVALGLGPVGTNPQESDEDEEIFLRACRDSFWVLRMIGYPPLPSHSSSTSSPSLHTVESQEIGQFSCGAHTDYGCVTLLLTDSTPNALHVQLKDGTWLPADPIHGTFVVNIGDMMQRWTNGIWKSTLHRVIHRPDGDGKGKSRISVPFFFEPNFHALVKPLEKCVEIQGGRRVEGKGTYGEHLLTKVFSNFYFSKRTEW